MLALKPKLQNLGHINVKTTTINFLNFQWLPKRSLFVPPSLCDTNQRYENKLQFKLLSTQVGMRQDVDEKSSSSVIGNKPQSNPSWYSEDETRKAKSISHLLRMAWEEYKATWEGFSDNLKKKSKAVEKEDDEENDNSNNYQISTDQLIEKQKEIKSNVDRNLGVLREEGASLIDFVKGVTGINNKRDLKVFAMEQLKLANECVAEFMKGYRFGRDDEFDKVMTEYFKDIDFNDGVDDSQTINDDSKRVVLNEEDSTETKRKRRRKSKQILK